MKYAFIAILAALIPACAMFSTKVPCETADIFLTPIVNTVTSRDYLDCDHPEIMENDFRTFAASHGLCEIKPKGVVGDAICPLVAAYAVDKFASDNTTAKRYGCRGTGVKAAFQKACTKINFVVNPAK
jgi:hypothetical protein